MIVLFFKSQGTCTYIYINVEFIHVFFHSVVIQALVALVNDPEPDHPLRADLAEEYVKDKRKFIKNAEGKNISFTVLITNHKKS